MKRRTFLKGVFVTAGAVVSASCSSDESDATPPTDGGEDASGGDSNDDASENDTIPVSEESFPQSVASGDPKPESVVLWTRVVGGAATLRLQVALDAEFADLVTLDGETERSIDVSPDHDGCVRVVLGGLVADTRYYYRFIAGDGDAAVSSRTGRTRTAPAPEADRAIRFAFVSCQDYAGHYYNTFRRLAQLDAEGSEIDFVVHLGDYIYETTSNPTFQDSSPERSVTFSDPTGAIVFDEGTENEYYAAATLGQYRELYQLYRTDPDLRRVHEQFPMIVIWDDHEFSDDCYGATGTYFAGERDEFSVSRRQVANQAWFEYMPVDYRQPGFEYDGTVEPPGDISIYRDFRFGAHLHLVMTDLRSYRTDHLIDEAALPGAIALDADAVASLGAEAEPWAGPYVDVGSYDGGSYQTAMKAQAEAAGYSPDAIDGLISVDFVNGLLDGVEGAPAPIDPEADGLAHGISYATMGKRGQYSSLGSRYLVVKDALDLFATHKWQGVDGQAQTMMGAEQEAWFLQTMQSSTATWKVWGNEFLLMPLVVDIRTFETLPDEFRQRFYILVDDWSGVRDRRDSILEALSQVDNVVAITGDIHAFFAGTPWVTGQPDKRIVELVTAGAGSNSLKQLLLRTALSDPTLADAGAAALAAGIKSLLTDTVAKPNPHLGFAEPSVQGFTVVQLDGNGLEAEMHQIDEPNLTKNLGDDLEGVFTVTRLRVEPGTARLQQEIDGQWFTWDPDAYDWV